MQKLRADSGHQRPGQVSSCMAGCLSSTIIRPKERALNVLVILIIMQHDAGPWHTTHSDQLLNSFLKNEDLKRIFFLKKNEDLKLANGDKFADVSILHPLHPDSRRSEWMNTDPWVRKSWLSDVMKGPKRRA